MAFFVWTKMQTELGMNLTAILALKEAERLAGGGIFWWGVGTSLGNSVRVRAEESGGTLPVLFSLMLSRPQKRDAKPTGIRLWTQWEDATGRYDLPANVLEFSASHEKERDYHYALVCHSHMPLALASHGAFDPRHCKTVSGKSPGSIQSTVLLEGDPYKDHSPGVYHFGFRATLVKPWAVKLVKPRKIASTDTGLFESWKSGWHEFVDRARSGTLPQPESEDRSQEEEQ